MSDSCQLTGTIPEDIGSLSLLMLLDLSSNNLMGSLPESVGGLSDLDFFAVSANKLTGKLSDSIGNWTKLRYLFLFTCGLERTEANHTPL